MELCPITWESGNTMSVLGLGGPWLLCLRRRRLAAMASPVGPLPILAQLVVLPPAGSFTSALVVLEGGSSLSLGSLCTLL